MHESMEQRWSWIDGSHGMRTGLLDAVSDSDLAFSPGGQAMTLGELCKEMGEIEYAYVQSLKTLKTDFSYRHPDPDVCSSVENLKKWLEKLDGEMKTVLEDFSEDDLNNKLIGRGSGYEMPIATQLDVYLQALLIFFGKATIYLRVMEKPLPPAIADWIG
ncbi:MAG: hypothetical protein L0154_30545 [Chloroflexi bacterium]|nr:hypothetical protein [Chloroflexota bacterium]